MRESNKQAIALIDEYYKGPPVQVDEPEPLRIGSGYTEQQIEDFCDMLEVGSEVIPGATAVIALQIIRQLQNATCDTVLCQHRGSG